MLSLGTLLDFAAAIAVRSLGLVSTSPPPTRAAAVISLTNFEKSFPRLESFAAFLCLIVDHLEWPEMVCILSDLIYSKAYLSGHHGWVRRWAR